MASTFLGLTIGYSGLAASQAALHTTGNNIANVYTNGYSKQQVTTTASEAMRAYASYGMVGTGVTVSSVKQLRDSYYDYKYWDNSARYGEYYTKNYYMKQIESYYEEENKSGISTALTNMFNSLQDLNRKPEDVSVKDSFVNNTQSMAEYLAELAASWENLQKDCNDEIKIKVDEINSIAQQLSILNKQINMIEVAGTAANELRDQRNLLIDQLSAIVDVEVSENRVPSNTKDSQGNPVYTGKTTYSVRIGGQILVDDYTYNTLKTVPREVRLNQSDVDGLYDIRWSNGQGFNMESTSLGGALQGLIEVRDGNNAENLQGLIGSVDIAKNSVTITGGTIVDMAKMTMPPSGKITLNSNEYYYDSFEYLGDGEYEFTLRDTLTQQDVDHIEKKNTDGSPKQASVGNTVEYCGIPYYMSKLNEFVRCFAQNVNEIHMQGQVMEGDQAGKAGLFLTGNKPVGGEYGFADTTIDSKSDTYYQLTAASFTVAAAILKDPKLLATTTNLSAGVAGKEIVEMLQNLQNSPIIGNATPSVFIDSVLSDIAVQTYSAKQFMDNHENIANTIINQRLSVSGVDEDEEALDLIKFQHAYNLSSKMISVLTEVYDRLILNTGV